MIFAELMTDTFMTPTQWINIQNTAFAAMRINIAGWISACAGMMEWQVSRP
jgi:hypothetical protein